MIFQRGLFIYRFKFVYLLRSITSGIYQDMGNCTPRFIRPTLYHIPRQKSRMKESLLPFAIYTQPFSLPESGEVKFFCLINIFV
jgi:hypothetical protein